MEWEDQAGSIRETTAILEDISRSGACLQTDVPVPVNALVRVRHGRKTLQGTVSYCAYHDIGYFTGVTFTAKQGWSRKVFRPKHLVDPGKLEIAPNAKPG